MYGLIFDVVSELTSLV